MFDIWRHGEQELSKRPYGTYQNHLHQQSFYPLMAPHVAPRSSRPGRDAAVSVPPVLFCVGGRQGRKYPSRSASWRSEGLEVSALVISYRHFPRRCVGWQFKREEKKYDGEGYC